MTATLENRTLAQALREQLLGLARQEEECAADELARVPYWKPAPPEVTAHREVANLLRHHADVLLSSIRAAAG